MLRSRTRRFLRRSPRPGARALPTPGAAAPALLALLLALLLSGCDVPRDPRGTLERVRGGTLRAGVAHAPPYAILPSGAGADGEPAGFEPDLLRAFAAELGASVAWTRGAPHELIAALEAGELDVVAGGLPAGGGPSGAVALPHAETRWTIGAAPGDPEAPASAEALDGRAVRARRGSVAAARARSAGARVEEVDVLRAEDAPVAASEAEILALGLEPAPFTLHRQPRALRVRPGENGFLHRLDRFVHGRKADAAELAEVLRAADVRGLDEGAAGEGAP